MNRNRFFQKTTAAVAALSVSGAPVVPALLTTATVVGVAVVELTAPAPAEAKPRWQAFVGAQNGTRRPVKADNLKSLKAKIEKRSGKFATAGVQNLSTGEWRPAPYNGKPAIDKFGNNLLQIR